MGVAFGFVACGDKTPTCDSDEVKKWAEQELFKDYQKKLSAQIELQSAFKKGEEFSKAFQELTTQFIEIKEWANIKTIFVDKDAQEISCSATLTILEHTSKGDKTDDYRFDYTAQRTDDGKTIVRLRQLR